MDVDQWTPGLCFRYVLLLNYPDRPVSDEIAYEFFNYLLKVTFSRVSSKIVLI